MIDICAACGQTIELDKPVTWHPPTERVWHVMCTPPIEHERGPRQHCEGGVEQVWRAQQKNLTPRDRVALAQLAL